MNRIAELQSEIETVRGLMAGYDEERQDLEDHTRAFFKASWEDRLQELQRALEIEQARRRKEIFELRLAGQKVLNTSMPLHLVAKLAEPLNKLVLYASYKLRHQHDAHHVPREWADMIDLRLAGLAHGSSRMILTANVAPDLAGDSPVQDALSALFEILNAPTSDFIEKLHNIGIRAGKSLAALIEAMEGESLACEFSWDSPDGKHYHWSATVPQMATLRVALEAVEEPAEQQVELSGEVALLAATGRIELRTQEGTARIRFDRRHPELIADLRIGQSVTLCVTETTYIDPVSGNVIKKYNLHPPGEDG